MFLSVECEELLAASKKDQSLTFILSSVVTLSDSRSGQNIAVNLPKKKFIHIDSKLAECVRSCSI